MMHDPDVDFYGTGDDPDAEYVCRLDSQSLETARVELNEEPRERMGAVKTFRRWILQQPHLKCPTGEWGRHGLGGSSWVNGCNDNNTIIIIHK